MAEDYCIQYYQMMHSGHYSTAAVRHAAGDGRHRWFSGNLMTIKAGEAGSDGLTVIEAWLRAGHAPPLHLHTDEDEAFYLLGGGMRFRCGEDEFDVSPGDFVLVPRGVPHAFKVSASGAHTLQVATSGELAAFIEAASDPAPSVELPASAAYDRRRVVAAAAEHGMVVVGPPLA